GPAAPYCASANTANLVLSFRPKSGTTNEKFDSAIRLGSLRLADKLGRLTFGRTPQNTEQLSLESDVPRKDLPRIAYILVIRQQGPLIQNFLYGVPTDGLVPTVIHPNELLDGTTASAHRKTG